MQVGITQLLLPEPTTVEFIRTAADTGYEVVELALRREGALTLETTEAERQRIVGAASDAGIGLVSMTLSHCTGNLLDSGPAQQTSIDETITGLEMAASMGIGCTLHVLGKMHADLYYDDAYDNAVTSLRQIAPTAERLNVTVAYEFTWNGFAFSPLEIRRLLDEVGSPRVGFYFDPGNMAVFHCPHHWVRILGPRIRMVHLKDWRGNALNGTWPPLLEGAVDFAAMNRHLREDAGYDGPMISEVPPDTAPLAATAEAIRRIIAM
ncbi:MAG: hypothetical protein CMJ18_00745 [Phycisphaeraceae bacterium]|nr:hypothetical protein [Phycisphaeraceae bacterium]